MRYIKSLLVLCCLLVVGDSWVIASVPPPIIPSVQRKFYGLFDGANRELVKQQVLVIDGPGLALWKTKERLNAYVTIFDIFREKNQMPMGEDFDNLFSLLKTIAIKAVPGDSGMWPLLKTHGDRTVKYANSQGVTVRYLSNFINFAQELERHGQPLTLRPG